MRGTVRVFVLKDYRVTNESEDENVQKKKMEIRKNATEIGH